MAMSTASQGIWLQELVDGKQVWHFYPTSAVAVRPGAQVEAPPPVAPADNIVVHPPGQHSVNGGGPHFTYNVYNTYNYPVATAAAAAAAAAAPEQKQETKAVAAPPQEGIRISEDEVKMDAILHEQAEAIRMMRHLYTVDYGAGDVYGRRWVTGG